MSDLREFVFPCVDVAGVMVPEHRYAELEEVVRCRDCRLGVPDDGGYTCTFFDMWHCRQDGFCAWGERRSE